MKARSSEATLKTRGLVAELQKLGWYHSLALPDGEIIRGLQSIEVLQSRIRQFPVPEDLRGKRVLDIGAWDGWFSFEMERRGAAVVAIDANAGTKFLAAKGLLESHVEYHIMDVLHTSQEELGTFEIVLFLGVLYHLKHPLLALEKVCALSTDLVCVESYVTDEGASSIPSMEFYETDELCGQFDNWSGPNTACLLAWCRTVGFARVRLESVIDHRAHVTCYRKWPPPQAVSEAPPVIVAAQNAALHSHSFSNKRDDYVAVWFRSERVDLTCDDVLPEVGGFGARPVLVEKGGVGGWHAIFKLPPGLQSGWHSLTVRTNASDASNRVRIGVDDPPIQSSREAETFAEDLEIRTVTDGRTWERNRIHLGPESCVSVWAAGIPRDVGHAAIHLRLAGTDLPAVFVSELDEQDLIQVNAFLPEGLARNRVPLAIVVDGRESRPVEVWLDD